MTERVTAGMTEKVTERTSKRRKKEADEAESIKKDAALSEVFPLRRSMADIMHVELVVNENAQIWVLHDKPFPAILHWVEYDQESNSLTFVTHDGKMQDLGMIIPDDVGDVLLDSDEICAMFMKDGEIQDMGIVPIMVRERVFH